MLELRSRTNRRSFLRIGSLGAAGLSLPQVLALRQAQAGPLGQAQAGNARRDTAVILFWMAGGPSHIDTFDMKPHAPEQIRGPFKAIQTRQPGLEVCELLPRHAQIADKLTVIRSLHHSLGVHDDASHWVQTGHPLLAARERGQLNPSQGSVVSYLQGAKQPGIPPYVCIPEGYHSKLGFYQNASFLGTRFNPVNGGGDPSLGNYRLPEFTLPAELTTDRVDHRRELLGQLNGLVRRVDRTGAIDAMSNVQQQAFDLVTGPKAREAFDLSHEPDALRDQYGRHAWGHAALLARRLVEAGVTFVTINLYEKNVDWWDDHSTIEKNLRKRLPAFDQALPALITDLHQRGLAERVLVVACGEFGRSPHVDMNTAGRGHWPRAMSAVLSGGGIRGGQIIGSTTADGGEPKDRPLGPGDLLSSIYRVLGIDHDQFLHDQQSRPIRLTDTGQPIAELF